MTAKGIDTTVSTITAAQLDAGGYDFIARYILNAPGGQNKQITKTEPARFTAGGKRVVSNFEWGENPADTVAEGKAHAKAFLDWAADFNVPDWSPCYFSLDANNPAGKYVNYFTGICDVITPERSGMYGNGACYRNLLAKGLISYAWQSKSSGYAGNGTTTGANIVQQLKTANVGGHTVDVNIAQTALYGGWLLGEDDPNMALTADDKTWIAETMRQHTWALSPPAGAGVGDVVPNNSPYVADSPQYAGIPKGTNVTTGAGYALGRIRTLAEAFPHQLADVSTAIAKIPTTTLPAGPMSDADKADIAKRVADLLAARLQS